MNNLHKKERHDPEFDKQPPYNYFKAKNKARNRNKLFCIPPWMKTPDPPKEEMNIDIPMCQETTKVISYMRFSASPCPIDQISIIILESCPIGAMLTKIIAYCW